LEIGTLSYGAVTFESQNWVFFLLEKRHNEPSALLELARGCLSRRREQKQYHVFAIPKTRSIFSELLERLNVCLNCFTTIVQGGAATFSVLSQDGGRRNSLKLSALHPLMKTYRMTFS
jgi:hypothetical protein